MSHRTDTKYWENNFNKNWEDKLINIKPTLNTGFLAACLDRSLDYHFKELSGLHCIAAGMNWSPTDMVSLKYFSMKNIKEISKEWIPYIQQLDNRKSNWKKTIKDKDSLYNFLKNNIYTDE